MGWDQSGSTFCQFSNLKKIFIEGQVGFLPFVDVIALSDEVGL